MIYHNKKIILAFLTLLFCLFPQSGQAAAPCYTYTHEGSNQYFFDDYEQMEYVDGELIIHFRLKTPYNDGRQWGMRFYAFTDSCNLVFHPFQFVTLTPGIRLFSIRVDYAGHYELWNDETNTPETCINCSGDLPALALAHEISFQGFVDGGFPDQFLSTSYPLPDEPTPPPSVAECCSSVLFLPGLQGSRLKMGNDAIWPPNPLSFNDEIAALALTEAGESVNPVTVDGIIDAFYGTPIYSEFSSYMNTLAMIDSSTGTSTIREWQPLAYDWRYAPDAILTNGIQTGTGLIDPVQEFELLASRSNTGKVTIVAHSMGGLVGKALIKALIDQGKEELIDSFVMVGVPQLGTSQAAAGLLHGDNQAIPGGLLLPGIIANPVSVRVVSQEMPSTFHLLPTPEYFSHVADPVVTFNSNASFTEEWRAEWGPSIDTYLEFATFLVGAGAPRTSPTPAQLNIPTILDTDLVLGAKDFHDTYDDFVFPDSIRVVQIAGWGLPTTKAIDYRNVHFAQGYRTTHTVEGDNTVVYPSAIAKDGEEIYFFNLSLFNNTLSEDIQHRDLLSASPVQTLIREVIKNEISSTNTFLSNTKPPLTEIGTNLLVSTHSPVVLGVYDEFGNFTGVNLDQDLSSDFLLTSENIPGSSFLSSGGSQYVFLPKSGEYRFLVNGVGSGPTTIEIQEFIDDTATDVALYSDIPFATSTDATFSINSENVQSVRVDVDTDGDGEINLYVADDTSTLSLEELLFNLKNVINSLEIQDKLKKSLLKKVEKIEKKIAKNKKKQASKATMSLEKKILKKATKDKLSSSEAEELLILLDDIERVL